MPARSILVFFWFVATTNVNANEVVLDPDALEFRDVSIYYSSPKGDYLNLRTVDSVRREPEYTLKSISPLFISRLYARIDGSYSACEPPKIVSVVIDFDTGHGTDSYFIDGEKLYSLSKDSCTSTPQGLLRNFDVLR